MGAHFFSPIHGIILTSLNYIPMPLVHLVLELFWEENGEWPDSWRHRNIAILEFYPIVLSMYLWGSEMSNRQILFFTDNEALVHVINKQPCRDKQLMLVCLTNNIVFKAKHIPGLQNKLADSLSRLQLQTFKQLAPAYMHQTPMEIPLHLQPI